METVSHQQSRHSRSAFFPATAADKPLSRTGNGDSQSQHIPSPDQKHTFEQANTSRGTAAGHRINSGQSSSAVRAWRFPSSRRFLWDRTAVGPCIQLQAQDFLPTVVVRPQAFASLQGPPEGTRELRVPAEWQVAANSAVSLVVGAGSSSLAHSTFSLSIEQGQTDLHECCFGDTSLQLAQALTAAVKTNFNTKSAVSIPQAYAVACHSNAAQLHCQLAIPGAAVVLTPLYAKKVCQVPLAQTLQAGLQQEPVKATQNGLLSMDQARSLLPLLADDPNASSVPLVGVWVSGIASPTHPLVWLACLKFFVTHQLQDKVTQGNEAFLLLLYTTGQNTAFQANRLLPMVVCNALATVISA
ncbi:hypothetical protein ABBQ38_000969 [Trebouxia sp. C0009 RCD-2024]